MTEAQRPPSSLALLFDIPDLAANIVSFIETPAELVPLLRVSRPFCATASQALYTRISVKSSKLSSTCSLHTHPRKPRLRSQSTSTDLIMADVSSSGSLTSSASARKSVITYAMSVRLQSTLSSLACICSGPDLASLNPNSLPTAQSLELRLKVDQAFRHMPYIRKLVWTVGSPFLLSYQLCKANNRISL